MLSRVADSLFWMSRYLERAEHIARVVNVNLNLTLDAGVRHVRVAIGRDYADVPPTHGTFKGTTSSTLAVSVEVTAAEALPTLDPR